MSPDRIESAIEERTHQMLGVARRDISARVWRWEDGLETTSVHLYVPIGEVPMENMRQWIAYLSRFAPGNTPTVKTPASHCELIIFSD